MKYASEALMREHESVLVGLEILEEFVKTMKNTGSADRDDADGIIRYIQLFADKCHHGKEEGLLFPAMERAGIPNQAAPSAKCFANTPKAGSGSPKWSLQQPAAL